MGSSRFNSPAKKGGGRRSWFHKHGFYIDGRRIAAWRRLQQAAYNVPVIAHSAEGAKAAAALHNRTFTTVIGSISFNANGDRIEPPFASYQWLNGSLKTTETVAINN